MKKNTPPAAEWKDENCSKNSRRSPDLGPRSNRLEITLSRGPVVCAVCHAQFNITDTKRR